MDSWVIITKFYALVTILAVALVAGAIALLALKVRRLVRVLKTGPRDSTKALKRTGEAARAKGEDLATRGKTAWTSTRESLTRAATHLDDAGRIVASRQGSETGLFEALAKALKRKREA